MGSPTRWAAAWQLALLLTACSPSPAEPTVAPTPAVDAADEPLSAPVAGDTTAALPLVEAALVGLRTRDYELAWQRSGQALDLDPASIKALLIRAQVQMTEGCGHWDLAAALKNVRLAGLLEPDNPGVIGAEGVLRFHLSQTERARPLLKRFLSLPMTPGLERKRTQAHEALGVMALREGKLDEADAQFVAALELTPDAPSVTYQRSRVAALRGNRDDEQRWLDATLRLDPHYLAAHYSSFLLLSKQGNVKAAQREREISDVLRQLADNISDVFKDDHQNKADLYGRLALLLPGDERSQVERIHELYLAGAFDAVVREGQVAWDQGKRWPRAIADLARAHARLGHAPEARQVLERWSQSVPTPPVKAVTELNGEIDRLLAATSSVKEKHP